MLAFMFHQSRELQERIMLELRSPENVVVRQLGWPTNRNTVEYSKVNALVTRRIRVL